MSEPLFTYIPTLNHHKAYIVPSASRERISIECNFIDPAVQIGTPIDFKDHDGRHLTTGFVSAIGPNGKSIQVSFPSN